MDDDISPELYMQILQGGSAIRGARPDINKSQTMAQELRKMSAMPKGMTVGPYGVYHAPNPLEYLGAALNRHAADQELEKVRGLEQTQADATTKQIDLTIRELLNRAMVAKAKKTALSDPTDDPNWNMR